MAPNGCYSLGCSAFFTFLGGALLVIGASIPQRRYSDYSSFNFRNYDMYFYTQKSSALGVPTITAPIPDCIKDAYGAGMAMGIIGGAFALLGGGALTYYAKRWQNSPLRLIRPAVLMFAGTCGLVATIISGATTNCNGVDFSKTYNLFAGFALLLIGTVFLFLSAVVNCAQAVSCPDPTSVSAPPIVALTHPQTQFAHYPQQPSQQQGTSFAPNSNAGADAPYSYNASQQQSYQGNNTISNGAFPYGGSHQHQGGFYGHPVVGIPVDSIIMGAGYGGGNGAPVYPHASYQQQPCPTIPGGPGIY